MKTRLPVIRRWWVQLRDYLFHRQSRLRDYFTKTFGLVVKPVLPQNTKHGSCKVLFKYMAKRHNVATKNHHKWNMNFRTVCCGLIWEILSWSRMGIRGHQLPCGPGRKKIVRPAAESACCRNPGLNQGPLDLQSNALPTELFRPTNERGPNLRQAPGSFFLEMRMF